MTTQEQLIYFEKLFKQASKLRSEHYRVKNRYPGAERREYAAGLELDKLLREINGIINAENKLRTDNHG